MEKMRYFLLGFGLILFAIWAAVLRHLGSRLSVFFRLIM